MLFHTIYPVGSKENDIILRFDSLFLMVQSSCGVIGAVPGSNPRISHYSIYLLFSLLPIYAFPLWIPYPRSCHRHMTCNLPGVMRRPRRSRPDIIMTFQNELVLLFYLVNIKGTDHKFSKKKDMKLMYIQTLRKF